MLEPTRFPDERGFFTETYRRERYQAAGIADDFVQDNHSRSRQGVLRGLHYQDLTAPMTKLVRCARGAIFDVAIDLRLGSKTFGRWFASELSDENLRQLYLPVGFAHGFLALSEWADVEYKCGGYYRPAAEGTIVWNDPELAIPWPLERPVISAKDAAGMTLADYRRRPAFLAQAAKEMSVEQER